MDSDRGCLQQQRCRGLDRTHVSLTDKSHVSLMDKSHVSLVRFSPDTLNGRVFHLGMVRKRIGAIFKSDRLHVLRFALF